MIRRLFGTPRPPIVIAVAVSIAVVVFFMVIGIAIGGSYLLTVHYVQTLQAQQHATQAKGAVGLCKAILQMDQAGKGAAFNATTGQAAYGRRLAAAIHQLYTSSGCALYLRK